MDSFLRTRPFRYDSMNILLARAGENFVHEQRREINFEERRAVVEYRWNSDSSITLIKSHKVFRKGFNREAIVHAGDSILFVHRFSTEPLGLENSDQYTFLEQIFYLTPTGTIKHLERVSYREPELKDTLAFRKKPFADLTDNISHYYSLELNHCRNMLTLN